MSFMKSWRTFFLTAVATFFALFGTIALFVVILNPYGNLPKVLPVPHAVMDINQRFQYPAVVRSQAFDSAVFGTSSSRLLNPELLDGHFGGAFANLAMNDAQAWEQAQLAKLFLRHVAAPRTLLFALDWVWCSPTADTKRTTRRGWPHWMYDEQPWNDWQFAINIKSVEIAGRLLAYRLGLKEPRIPANGYEVFVPPESAYDLTKARAKIWQGRERIVPPPKPPYEPSSAELAAWRNPALPWLEEVLGAAPKGTRKIIAFMPNHVALQATPGSVEAERIDLCKARVAAIAKAHDAHFVDFWIRSPITLEDRNYWDGLHYRVPIGDRIVNGIAAAVRDVDASSEDYRTTARLARSNQMQ